MNAISKLTITKLTLGMLLFAGPQAIAGQGKDQAQDGKPKVAATAEDTDLQEGIVLEEPATSVKAAMERRAAAETEAAAELEAAQKVFQDRMAAVNQRTVADLIVIARRAVADGELADAAKAWEEVLRLDGENEAAKAFFKTIGREDVVQKRLAKIPGDDRRVWRRDGSRRHSFVLQSDGTWKEFGPNGRVHAEWNETARDEYVIEMQKPDGEAVRIHRSRYYYTADGENWKGGMRGRWD